MKPKVWFTAGHLIIYGAALDTDEHQHNALQIVWPIQASRLKLENTILKEPVVIAANVQHRLTMELGWIILVEPQSGIGEALMSFLNGLDFQILKSLPAQTPAKNDDLSTTTIPIQLLSQLWEAMQITWNQTILYENLIPSKLDKRIAHLQSKLNACFKDECVKPEHWRAVDVATELKLSEGRFRHLFRQEMGIAWRPYLLWRRLLCAVSAIKKGRTATEAAYIAGFSDSSHLSRTFRRTFGLTIRQAVALFE